MTVSDLRDAVEEIELDEDSRQRMIRNLRRMQGKNRYHHNRMLKGAAVAAIAVMTAGALSIPVRALVNSLVQERMEQIPEETLQTAVIQLEEQEAEADSFSRDYTASERERMTALWKEYREGTFPEGAILQVADEAAAEGQEFYFQTAESRFYLPEGRELTDEEILQIIDFNEIRKYALQENAAERNAAAAEQIVAEGGISKQESITVTGDYLQSIFGVDADVMESNSYFNEAVPEGESIWDEAYYNVHWEGQNGELYCFSLRADDGMLLSANPLFTGTGTEQDKPAVLDAAEEAALIKAEAEDFLRNTIDINETYDRVEICYYIFNGAEVSDTVDVTFLKADGNAYQVTYTWDHEVKECGITTAEIYESVIEYNAESLAEKQGGNVIVEVVRE